jgi:hypothetical protein
MLAVDPHRSSPQRARGTQPTVSFPFAIPILPSFGVPESLLKPCRKRHKERRAKAARRSFAFYSPRPPLLRDFTKEIICSNTKPSEGDFVAGRGLIADAFFGASPVVASALGIRSGATPCGRVHTNTPPLNCPSKQDISTLLGIGHFYFALTWCGRCFVAAK